MPRKVRQFKKQLKDLGFDWRPGKGRHQIWKHPLLVEPIVIARKDGDDVPCIGLLGGDFKSQRL